jgi:hypothetical protein
MLVSELRIGAEQPLGHHEVTRNLLRINLSQGSQLTTRGRLEICRLHIIGHDGLVNACALRRPRITPVAIALPAPRRPSFAIVLAVMPLTVFTVLAVLATLTATVIITAFKTRAISMPMCPAPVRPALTPPVVISTLSKTMPIPGPIRAGTARAPLVVAPVLGHVSVSSR